MKTFVTNQNNLQEKILIGYFSIFLVGSFYSFGFYPMSFTVLFFILAFLVYVGFSLLVKKADNSKPIFFFLLFGFIFIIGINVFFHNYLPLFLICGFVFFSVYKSDYLPKIKEQNDFSNKSLFDRILLDFLIVEYHYHKEFELFNYLRYTNIAAILLCIRFFYVFIWYYGDDFSDCAFWEIPTFINISCGILLNFIILNCVQWIIVDHCNPPVSFTILQKCAICFSTSTLGVFGYYGFHIINTTPGLTPLPVPGSNAYQHMVLGYKYNNSSDGVLAHVYIGGDSNRMPPCDANNFVDGQRIKDELKVLSKEKLDILFEGIPKYLRPDVNKLVGIEKEVISTKTISVKNIVK